MGGDDPRVVLEEVEEKGKWIGTRRFHAYQLQDHRYVKLWSRDLAQHFTTTDNPCRIAVTETGGVLLQERKDSATLLVNQDGSRVVETWTQEGRMIGVLPSARPAYTREREDGRYEVLILEDDRKTVTILPHTWRRCDLSVCGNQQREIAVTSHQDESLSWEEDTLSIFATRGDHHIKLTYRPGESNCASCSNDAIYVAEAGYAAVNIHLWTGQRLQRITRQQLGSQWSDWIRGVMWSNTHNSLLLVTHDIITERPTMRAYRVDYQYAMEEMAEDRRRLDAEEDDDAEEDNDEEEDDFGEEWDDAEEDDDTEEDDHAEEVDDDVVEDDDAEKDDAEEDDVAEEDDEAEEDDDAEEDA